MNDKQQVVCCELNCQQAPEWEIWWGDTLDDNTLACTQHVGELLNPDDVNRVSRYQA